MSTSIPLSIWLNCREDVSVNQKDTTDVSQQQPNRLCKGKGSSCRSSYTHKHTQAQRKKAVSDTRSSWGVLCASHPSGASPSCTAPCCLLSRKQMPQEPLLQPQGCNSVCFPLVTSWSYLLLLILALPGKSDFFLFPTPPHNNVLCFSRV